MVAASGFLQAFALDPHHHERWWGRRGLIDRHNRSVAVPRPAFHLCSLGGVAAEV